MNRADGRCQGEGLIVKLPLLLTRHQWRGLRRCSWIQSFWRESVVRVRDLASEPAAVIGHRKQVF